MPSYRYDKLTSNDDTQIHENILICIKKEENVGMDFLFTLDLKDLLLSNGLKSAFIFHGPLSNLSL